MASIYVPYSTICTEPLRTRRYEGTYILWDGRSMEAWETDPDTWEYDDGPEPLGQIYYAIYDEDGAEVDGGVMGYGPGDTLADLQHWLGVANSVRIACRILGGI